MLLLVFVFLELYDFIVFLWLCFSRFSLVHAKIEWLVNYSHLVKAEHRLQLPSLLLLLHLLLLLSSLLILKSEDPSFPFVSSLLPFCPSVIPRVALTLPSHLWCNLSLFLFSVFPFCDRSALWMHSVAPSMKAWKNQTPEHPSTTSWHTPSLG